jgi:mono/diheme cytochrome c family protein
MRQGYPAAMGNRRFPQQPPQGELCSGAYGDRRQPRHRFLRMSMAAAGVGFVLACMMAAAGNPPRVEASSKQDRQAGAALFHEKGCEHCHGVDGVGTDRAPSLTTVGKRRKQAQIVQQIEQGGKGMPAYGDVLQPEEIKWLAEFLHAKRKAPKGQPSQPPPTPPPPSDAGL